MKLYSISLTITDLEDNRQIVSVQAPRLNGKQIVELAHLTTAGILIEPEPEIATVPKHDARPGAKHRKAKVRNPFRSRNPEITTPPGFDSADMDEV